VASLLASLPIDLFAFDHGLGNSRHQKRSRKVAASGRLDNLAAAVYDNRDLFSVFRRLNNVTLGRGFDLSYFGIARGLELGDELLPSEGKCGLEEGGYRQTAKRR
jgi:hypothetical protein